ncbi:MULTISPECIES: helix-turn-helix domain-containing protein [unclassified Tenacibaculum]|uniref:helix-turn-helix domain-containing protein n=1 Tax=unclassified Tenacibaculum TaxID=2635139 RepID=UPI001F19D609|nr:MULTISPECIES: response regulator transcription factor [unclassified Tenacibaculum]MCF2875759.1 helix-turn-helix transcriptional regulator [Tenacibaculum sp. Cn5-1]MCF2935835.1 helix-turn-helix transcriptional regulator [Tenacibaculum sp. Cn5-34]MCG7512395.1 helix-turn-helix transcriptional regulator [Tenacibaculum sp. Cn5-46]
MPVFSFNNISEMHKYYDFPEPENPLFSILHSDLKENEKASCETYAFNEPVILSCDFYSISFKNIISGELSYGRTKYDCTNGTMLFTAPNQTLTFNDMVFSSESYHISFHKDYIRNLDIYESIKKYNFFNYNVNEALHLSPKEEQIIKDIFKNIKTEYHNNQDEFSKEIIISQLDTLLKYADRFYKRQFLNRTDENKILITRFKEILNSYFEQNLLTEEGIPTVNWMAAQLNVSHRYMSDTIKAETGKTAVDQINLFLVEEAKSMLLNPNLSISETAYKLGFEYPQYFTRVFKKKVGMSPKEYIKNHSLN